MTDNALASVAAPPGRIAAEAERRRTFAVISHPDAGKSTLTEALALEVAGDGILVNAIAPGPILAPPDTTEEEHEAVERNIPLGKWGGPEAIVTAVMALIESDFITGETVRVDGGRHLY